MRKQVFERWAGAHSADALFAEVAGFARYVGEGFGAVAAARAVDASCKARMPQGSCCQCRLCT
jgi:hypothetical protein